MVTIEKLKQLFREDRSLAPGQVVELLIETTRELDSAPDTQALLAELQCLLINQESPFHHALLRLIQALQRIELEPNLEELADMLWLAGHIRMPRCSARFDTPKPQVADKPPGGTDPVPPQSDKQTPLPAAKQEQPEAPLHLPGRPPGKTGGAKSGRYFRTPSVAMLPNALALGRALRPLIRNIPSRTQYALDEDATIERMAEERLRQPVLRGVPERWLDLTVVADRGHSMLLWQQTIAELCDLLKSHGAFRDTRVWSLDTDHARPVLFKGGQCPRDPRELNSRLSAMLLISDCVSPAWHEAHLLKILMMWARSQPLALIQMLPPRLWPGTALYNAGQIKVAAGAPLLPNNKLKLTGGDVWLAEQAPNGLCLPLLSLEPGSFSAWAGLLNGKSGAMLNSAFFDAAWLPGPEETADDASADVGDARQHLRNFYASASPLAKKLAAYLSAAPLNLAVMRMIQQLMLPQSGQSHLAEVFLGGLLKRRNPEETDPARLEYDFYPGVRDLLLETVPAIDIRRVLEKTSQYVSRHIGQSRDFQAVLQGRFGGNELKIHNEDNPFAAVAAHVLERLGGHWPENLTKEEITKDPASSANKKTAQQKTNEVIQKPPRPFRDRLQDASLGPEMIFLAGGTFRMGDDKSDHKDEKPAHQVSLGHFGIGKYPLTFEEYDRFCEAAGREKSPDKGWGRGRRPVIYISWDEAAAYCKWLSKQTGQLYRLLTEAQWEYACRAGSEAAYCFGDDKKQLAEYAWHGDPIEGATHPVGEKKPNAWDLYDMHGNVWEWVLDWYGNYSAKAQQDPSGPESGSLRVVRGGSWDGSTRFCRSAVRNGYGPGARGSGLGFRLARTGPLHSYPFTLDKKGSAEAEASEEKTYEPGQVIFDSFAERVETSPEMVYIPAGKFMMGSPKDEEGRFNYEGPVHEVVLDHFAIGKFPVTVKEYLHFARATDKRYPEWMEKGSKYHAVTGTDKRYKKLGDSLCDEACPIVGVSWEDAKAYCEWLSAQTGEKYALLTEAQWEYACRAGTATRYYFGDDEKGLEKYAWYDNNADDRPQPVGEKGPNGWGLHDMHGNVWEWVNDYWADRHASSESQINPRGSESGSNRVIRGGGWGRSARFCRSALRRGIDPGRRGNNLGFRLARTIP
ncbi:MAG: SUMF1/EgtB/PvdO family nonheme iron enzyme [Gammaproteobacteria bacterium]|nr:SUMF1/EgtB/PvdO family nonheme iron enzyme [Gammaproteobacteria bacterium]